MLQYVRTIIERVFHHDVDSVLSSLNRLVDRLEKVESRKAAEAQAHEDAIREANAKKEAAAAERGRAASVRQRVLDLIS